MCTRNFSLTQKPHAKATYKAFEAALRTVDQGADTMHWLVLTDQSNIPEDANGCFFRDRAVEKEHFTLGGTSWTDAQAEDLWAWCNELTSEKRAKGPAAEDGDAAHSIAKEEGAAAAKGEADEQAEEDDEAPADDDGKQPAQSGDEGDDGDSQSASEEAAAKAEPVKE